MASKIENCGILGGRRTCALVERHGAIEWLCVPRFDADACFASLLGLQEHGHWKFLLRDGRVRRYAAERSLNGRTVDEGVFLPCSVWLGKNYAYPGRIDEAEKYGPHETRRPAVAAEPSTAAP
jgi:GH15 family glucan-1,4-alpha-glucosidase